MKMPGLTLALLASDAVRTQDAPYLFQVALMNRDLGGDAWAYVRDHWATITPRFTKTNTIALAQGARWLTAADEVEDIQAFFEANDIPQAHLTLRQAMERQRLYAALRRRSADRLAARFGATAVV